MKKKVFRLCFIIFFLPLYFPWGSLRCQDFNTVNYTVKDGLPGSEVFDILQDRDGNLWFATDFGVCRYDGYEFKTFTTLDGLAENSNVVGFLDREGKPWFSGYTGGLSYYENGRVHGYRYNDSIRKYSNGLHVYGLCSGEDSCLTITASRMIMRTTRFLVRLSSLTSSSIRPIPAPA